MSRGERGDVRRHTRGGGRTQTRTRGDCQGWGSSAAQLSGLGVVCGAAVGHGVAGPARAGHGAVRGVAELRLRDLAAAEEAGGPGAADDGAPRRHGLLEGLADRRVVDGEEVRRVDVEEAARGLEERHDRALLGPGLVVGELGHDAVHGLVRRDLGRQVVLLAEVDGPFDNIRIREAHLHGHPRGDDAADGDGLAVAQAAERPRPVRDGLDGVAERVAVDEHDGLALLLGVDVDDLALELDGPADDLLEEGRVQQRAVVVVEHVQ
mmetsp:Transcript_22611/g.77829  ORF Transcript_22611/g.77829 Transcript_22611/m.77829 type:complete len:265 (+) Transcript_22611:22-816(+)